MPCSKEKKILLWLIESYKNMPYLWQKDHEDYMNKHLRDEGFKVLLEIYKDFDESATVKNLKKKIENLRTSYSKELKKVLASKRAGKVYVPSLWYYDALKFISNDTVCDHTLLCDSLDKTNSSLDDESASDANSNNSRRKRKKIFSRIEEKEYTPIKENTTLTEKDMAKNNEEFEIYGRSIGFQMKDLSKRQLMISQKMISDVLYYAKLEQLSESSCVYLGPSDESTSNNSLIYQD
ncbi:hypothetical protein MSG28_004840 [Choristoneura fumiferana]|uniref:Uncharacterized protein n=1 Tax=Choristoneura fumiferana TaxID=7141 RepID=A0ACC0K7Q2_CHOFU|nr:hypothetical protein MSG28_004840 [Choristoneura fumiferana]